MFGVTRLQFFCTCEIHCNLYNSKDVTYHEICSVSSESRKTLHVGVALTTKQTKTKQTCFSKQNDCACSKELPMFMIIGSGHVQWF